MNVISDIKGITIEDGIYPVLIDSYDINTGKKIILRANENNYEVCYFQDPDTHKTIIIEKRSVDSNAKPYFFIAIPSDPSKNLLLELEESYKKRSTEI